SLRKTQARSRSAVLMYNSLQKARPARSTPSQSSAGRERMPSVGTPRGQQLRLFRARAEKKIARLVEEDTINKELLVLEAVYEDETKRLCNEDDDLTEVSPQRGAKRGARLAGLHVTDRSQTSLKQNKEKPHFRSVANAIPRRHQWWR
uniref:JADE2 n=1 Tax=Macrostomum lignano TaxID=282301 RepID=A0A1I8FFE1_9PLAT